MKQRKILACSSPLDQDSSASQELKGKVYNIFPYIRDPDPKKQNFPMNRAFTLLGIINAIFFPIRHEDEFGRLPAEMVRHEVTHYILGSTMVACEERFVAARLIGCVYLLLLNRRDVRLLIPSFTIVQSGEQDLELHNYAESLDRLHEAYEAVHEIVACAIQIENGDWDRSKARQIIEQHIEGDPFDKKTLNEFLDVYEKFGPIGVYWIGQYALNKFELTKRSALERFKRATEVACKYNWKIHGTGPIEYGRMAKYIFFLYHLDCKLPDFKYGRCPIAGAACIPHHLDAFADSIMDQSQKNGNRVNGKLMAAAIFRTIASRMKAIRCGREQQHNQGNGPLLPSSMHEVFQWFDPEVRSIMGKLMSDDTQEASDRIFPLLALVEHENCDYNFTIGTTLEEKERSLYDISPRFFWVVMIEATLQQMMCGEGPLCLCYPHQPVDCLYRYFLRVIWERTEPDPEWHNNWKQPTKKPPCIE